MVLNYAFIKAARHLFTYLNPKGTHNHSLAQYKALSGLKEIYVYKKIVSQDLLFLIYFS